MNLLLNIFAKSPQTVKEVISNIAELPVPHEQVFYLEQSIYQKSLRENLRLIQLQDKSHSDKGVK